MRRRLSAATAVGCQLPLLLAVSYHCHHNYFLIVHSCYRGMVAERDMGSSRAATCYRTSDDGPLTARCGPQPSFGCAQTGCTTRRYVIELSAFTCYPACVLSAFGVTLPLSTDRMLCHRLYSEPRNEIHFK